MKKIALLITLILLTSCIIIEEVPVEETYSETQPQMDIKPRETIKQPTTTKPEETKIIKEESYIKEFLKTIPNQYWYYNVNDGIGGLVLGDKRATGWSGDDPKISLLYWNPDTKEVYIYFTEMTDYELEYLKSEPRTVFKDPNPRNQHRQPVFIKVTEQWDFYPFSPVDWMKEYQNAEPVKIETAEQTLNIENRYYVSNLILHFQDDDGSKTVMKFDKNHKVPVMIEKTYPSGQKEIFKYHYDTYWYDPSTDYMTRGPITEEIINLPKEHAIITMQEAQRYDKEIHWQEVENPRVRKRYVMELFIEKDKLSEATY